jgi:tetratricopeptide (TPR) repeat protein
LSLPFLPLGATILVSFVFLLVGFHDVILLLALIAIGAIEYIFALRVVNEMVGDIREGGSSAGAGPALLSKSIAQLPNIFRGSPLVYSAIFILINLALLTFRFTLSGPVVLGDNLDKQFSQARKISSGVNLLSGFTAYNTAMGIEPDFEIGYIDMWDDLALMGVAFDPDAEQALVSQTVSDLAIAHALYAKALGDKGRHKEGMLIAQEALRLDPSQAYVQFVWGFLNQRERNVYTAIEAFEAALEADPEMFDAYLFLGIVHNGRGNAYLAMDYLTQAIDIAIKPADVSMAHTHRGLTYATLKRYDESFADLETALDLDPSNDLASWVHGVVSKQIAEEEAAEAEQGTEPGVGLGLNP